MSTLAAILVSGALMSAIAMVGGITLLLPEDVLRRALTPMVGLAAGSMLGGALFHLLPESIAVLGDGVGPWVWVAVGFLAFLVLEQGLAWHHCHRAPSEHRVPVTWLILVADGVHNLIGGLAVGGAFVVDPDVGWLAWIAAAAHEIPQEIGDFGVLVHGGWSPRRALGFNLVSALTFPLGGLIAWAASGAIDVAFLLPLGAGGFLYIAAADLVPELGGCGGHRRGLGGVAGFVVGLGLLLAGRLALAGA